MIVTIFKKCELWGLEVEDGGVSSTLSVFQLSGQTFVDKVQKKIKGEMFQIARLKEHRLYYALQLSWL